MAWRDIGRAPGAEVRVRRALAQVSDPSRNFQEDSIDVDDEGRAYVVPDNAELIIASQVYGVH